MKRLIDVLVMMLFFTVGLGRTSADDIEIYFNVGAESDVYVLLMLDLRSSTFSTQVNKFSSVEVYGVDTFDRGENVITADAYKKLVEYDNPGADDKINVFQIFRAVLAGVLEKKRDDDPTKYAFDGINMALAVANNYEPNVKLGDGGSILEGYKVLGAADPNEDGRIAIVDALSRMPGELANPHEFGGKETYYEWYNYLNGRDVEFGRSTEVNFDRHVTFDPNVPDFDPEIMDDPNGPDPDYIAPFDDIDECPNLFSIVVAMQGPPKGQDDSLNTEIVSVLPGANGGKNEFNVTDMMQYMHLETTDLIPGITQVTPLTKSWVISDDGSIGQTRAMAEAGKSGTPLSISDPVQLEEDLINLLGEVLSVSSTFVAASVPVNVFNQTRSLDNLFIALFEAEDNIAWPGNVKKLKLWDDPNDPDESFDRIIDATPAPNTKPGFETGGPNKGRIFATALTFWTDKTELSAGTTGVDPNAPEFIPLGVDGRVVERGGAGQKIPGVIQDSASYPQVIGDGNGINTRQIYVEDFSQADNLRDFATGLRNDATFRSLLGAEGATATDMRNHAEELIRWGRGQDLDDLDGDTPRDTSDARPWLLADAIHSRPFALNYGDTDGAGGFDEDNPNIVLLFGTGDGMFHAVRNTDGTGNELGREIFGFYPQEMLPQIKRRRNPASMNDGRDMRYGIDGAPVVLTVDANSDGSLTTGDSSGDEAYVYFGLRRGGYSYYALDVIDPTSPKLVWKVTQTRNNPGNSDFDELGLTFSTPYVGKVQFEDDPTDVLIFGGGYHGGWDPNDPTATSQIGKDVNADDDPYGNAIYIVNARTGELVWKATQGGGGSVSNTVYQHPQMLDSIPSEVTVLENPNGVVHRIYVGDTGGAVWRVDLPVANEDDLDDTNDRADKWFVTRLADLTPGGEDRRFFHAPDVVEAELADGTALDGVIIQSGNRADPLDKRDTLTPADNYLFYLRDYNVVSGVVPNDPSYVIGDLSDRTTCLGSFTETDGTTCEPLNGNGWKIKLATTGEKGLSTPLVDAGRVISTTYIPGVEGVCGEPAEGRGRLYLVNLIDGSNVNNQRFYELGPGIPSGAVLIGDVIWIPGGGAEGTGGDGGGGDGGCPDGILCDSLTERLIPIYWREPGIDKL